MVPTTKQYLGLEAILFAREVGKPVMELFESIPKTIFYRLKQ